MLRSATLNMAVLCATRDAEKLTRIERRVGRTHPKALSIFFMAKADFCFTYYDGDAASDMQHMNRLERGAYSDLVLFQRKIKGAFALDQVKKFLNKDFDAVWGAMELILKQSNDGKYYIEWLAKSEEKAKKHAKKQSENRKFRTKEQPNGNQTVTKHKPNINQTQPLGDGDGDGDGIENEKGNEVDFSKPDIPGDDLVFPIDTDAARKLWAEWKRYRYRQHGQRYGMMGEQADLKRLERMDFSQMQKTILTAIANNWKNLYPDSNGKFNRNSKAEQSKSTSDYLAEYYRNKAEQK